MQVEAPVAAEAGAGGLEQEKPVDVDTFDPDSVLEDTMLEAR